MAKNIKISNLKINTNLENIHQNKSSANAELSTNLISQPVRKSFPVNQHTPEKVTFSSNSGHVPSYSMTGGSQKCEFYEDKWPETALRSNSKDAIINCYKSTISQYELDLEVNSIPPSTFSPRSTKETLDNSKHLMNGVNKYLPLSTRNGKVSSFRTTSQNGEEPSTKLSTENNNPDTVELINVMSLLGFQSPGPLTINNLDTVIPNFENSKYSTKSMTYIKAFAANTHQGIVRNYNEDRVSIILNIMKPPSYTGENWPKCSFFGIYDGHGGATCADYLRDNLHQFIVKDSNFPYNVKQAIKNGFDAAEEEFMRTVALSKDQEVLDRSGSCALVALIVNQMCHIANVGDSRAVMSVDGGKHFSVITTDHRPNEPNEKKRIVESGGKVYQTQTPAKNFNLLMNKANANQVLVGPYRVFPGRLSVSRTFGDVEAKCRKFGGLPNVIIPSPDIFSFEISSDTDFIVMGCDGVFDQLSNKEIIDCVWMTTEENRKCQNIHLQCGSGVDMILKSSLIRKTLDNVTCVMIAFENFASIFHERSLFEENSKYSYSFLSNINNNSLCLNTLTKNEKKINDISNLSSLQLLDNKEKSKKMDLSDVHNTNKVSLTKLKDIKEVPNGLIELMKNSLKDQAYNQKRYFNNQKVALDLSTGKKNQGNVISTKNENEKDRNSVKNPLSNIGHVDNDKKFSKLFSSHNYRPATVKHSISHLRESISSGYTSFKKI